MTEILRCNSGSAAYYLADGLGSTTQLVDGSGSVTDTYTYDVFGALRSSSGSTSNAFDFAGQQTDHAANRGLQYLRARHYDPSLGRFLQRDPVPFAQRYAYVGNNPPNRTDPSGLRWDFQVDAARDAACGRGPWVPSCGSKETRGDKPGSGSSSASSSVSGVSGAVGICDAEGFHIDAFDQPATLLGILGTYGATFSCTAPTQASIRVQLFSGDPRSSLSPAVPLSDTNFMNAQLGPTPTQFTYQYQFVAPGPYFVIATVAWGNPPSQVGTYHTFELVAHY